VFLGALLVSCATEPAPVSPSLTRDAHVSLLLEFPTAQIEHAPIGAPKVHLATVDGVERAALYAHAPSRIRYPGVAVHENSILRFDFGVADGSRCDAADGVEFRVLAPDVRADPLWSGTAGPSGSGGWETVEVPLAALAGTRVDLVLETDPRNGPECDWSSWARPVIESSGSAVRLSDHPVRRHHVLDEIPLPPVSIEEPGAMPPVEWVVPGGERLVLRLAGEIRRAGGERGRQAASFRASLDGDEVFREKLETRSVLQSFERVVTLGPVAEGARLRLEIDTRGDGTMGRWTRAWIAEERAQRRSLAVDGPNLLFVLVDTLRADRLSTYGYSRETSPRLDRLASTSLVFDNAISPSPWTLPTVASLFTALYPPTHRVDAGIRLAPSLPTLAERLQDAGFTTMGVSASPVVGPLEGFHRGFERFVQIPWMRAELTNELVSGWIRGQSDLRWFAYVHYIDPHDPYDAPEPWGDRFTAPYAGRFGDREEAGKLFQSVNYGNGEVSYDDADIAFLSQRYDGEILYWDHWFGELVDDLQVEGLLENTVLVLVSDHGEEFLEHGKLKHEFHHFEETVRVPLLLRAPGLPPGRVAAQVETRWLLPAILQLLGIEVEAGGQPSLLRPAPGPAFMHTTHALLPSTGKRTEMAGVRLDGHKLMLRPADGWLALYDLDQDPGELEDVSGAQAGLAGEYRALVEAWLAGTKAVADADAQVDPALVEQLRALGYVQ
jgi:arylsulfatase